jgi:hypothetical protein
MRPSAIATAFAIVLAAATAYAAPAGASTATRAGSTRSAHVAFGSCNAQDIVLSVTAPRHAFRPTEQVAVTVRLRNAGSTTCGSPLARRVPEAHHALSIGPCGTMQLTVRNESGVAVYPGPLDFFCPEESGFRLGPHSSSQATAYWNQTAYVGTGTGTGSQTTAKQQHAAPGTYRLTVDGAVSVPVSLISNAPS